MKPWVVFFYSGGGESGSTGRDEDDREMGGNESSPGEIEKFLSRFVQDAMESTECSKEYTEKAFAELHSKLRCLKIFSQVAFSWN